MTMSFQKYAHFELLVILFAEVTIGVSAGLCWMFQGSVFWPLLPLLLLVVLISGRPQYTYYLRWIALDTLPLYLSSYWAVCEQLLDTLNARQGMELDVQHRKWWVFDCVYVSIKFETHFINTWVLWLQIDEAVGWYSFLAKMLSASWME